MKLGSLIRDKASGLMKGSSASLKSEVSGVENAKTIDNSERENRKSKGVDHSEQRKESTNSVKFSTPPRSSPMAGEYTKKMTTSFFVSFYLIVNSIHHIFSLQWFRR